MKFYNTEMEAAVLGTFLANEDLLLRLIDQISPESFFEPLHQDIFRYMRELVENGEKVSPFRLYNHYQDILGEHKSYLSSLAARGNAFTLKGNIDFLNELYQKRRLVQICNGAIAKLESDGEDVAGGLVSQVMQVITGEVKAEKTMQTALEDIYNEAAATSPAYKARTGIKVVDLGTAGGLQKGRVYCFMAAAKHGKTMIAATISNFLNDTGYKHLYVCAEMGVRELVQRMLGQKMEIAPDSFLTPSLGLKTAVANKIVTIRNNVFFEDEPSIEFETLKRVVIKHVFKNKIDGFILDYFQLVTGQERHETQAAHYEKVANWIAQICKKYNIWCILLAQTNDDGRVLGSRGINRACDQGYLLERKIDEKGDPMDDEAWLKMRFSRYTRIRNLGHLNDPSLRISANGTHVEDY